MTNNEYRKQSLQIAKNEMKIRKKLIKNLKISCLLGFGYVLPKDIILEIMEYIKIPISEESNKKQFMLNNNHVPMDKIEILWNRYRNYLGR
jgi:hypothetical protein